MKELQEILGAYRQAERDGRRAVLATIVKVSGSTYRRPGARMLVTDDGRTAGFISGGCLEEDLSERAAAVLESGGSEVVIYDMTSPDDLVWGLGLGCNGVVHVLLERLPGGDGPALLRFLADCLEARRRGVVATLFRADRELAVGRRLMLDADGAASGSLGDPELDRVVLGDAREVLTTGRATRVASYPGAEVLIEWVGPPPPLVIFGAGPDAVPLVRFAKSLGWHVTVADHRAAYASRDKFPEADEIVHAGLVEMRDRVELDERSLVVVMTHNYHHDLELLEFLLPAPVRYLGVIGPRQRTRQLLADLAKRGVAPGEERLRSLHGPLGLDIGGDTPEEIALAALAEIQAVLTGRGGGFLQDREGPLHDRVE